MDLSRSFQPGRVYCCSGTKYGCVPHEIVTRWFLMSLLMPQKAVLLYTVCMNRCFPVQRIYSYSVVPHELCLPLICLYARIVLMIWLCMLL